MDSQGKLKEICPLLRLTILNMTSQSFDAVEMRKKLMKKQKVQDLEHLITIGLVCGNDVVKIKAFVKEKYKKLLTSWEKTHKLVSIAGNRDAVTLSRVIACFPEVTALVLHKNRYHMVVSCSSLLEIAAEFPMAARHGDVAGVIPGTLKKNDLLDCLSVFMVPNLLIFERFNVDNADWQSASKSSKVIKSLCFLLNSYHNKVVSPSKRVKVAEAIGMVVSGPDGLTLSDVWRNAAKKCAEWLYSKYNFKVHEKLNFV